MFSNWDGDEEVAALSKDLFNVDMQRLLQVHS